MTTRTSNRLTARTLIIAAAAATVLLSAGGARAQYGAVLGPDRSAGAAVCEFTAPAGSVTTYVYCWVVRNDGFAQTLQVPGVNSGVGTAEAVTAWADNAAFPPSRHYGCVFGEWDASDGLRYRWAGCNPLAP